MLLGLSGAGLRLSPAPLAPTNQPYPSLLFIWSSQPNMENEFELIFYESKNNFENCV